MTTILERIKGARQRARNEAEKVNLPPIYAPHPGRKVALKMAIEFADRLIAVFEEAAGPAHTARGNARSTMPPTARQATLAQVLAMLRRTRLGLAQEFERTVEPQVPQSDMNRHQKHLEQLKGEIKIQHMSLLDTVQHLLINQDWKQVEVWALDAVRRASVIERDLVSRIRR